MMSIIPQGIYRCIILDCEKNLRDSCKSRISGVNAFQNVCIPPTSPYRTPADDMHRKDSNFFLTNMNC